MKLLKNIVVFLLMTIIVMSCPGPNGSSTIAVTGIIIHTEPIDLGIGATLQMQASIEPENASLQDVSWESSESGVVEIDESGLVTAKALGTAIISVTTKDGNFTDQCSIDVKKAYTVTFESNEGSTVNSVGVLEGHTLIFPENPEKKGYTFSGWFSDEDLFSQWHSDSVVKEPLTLYAKWSLTQYSIHYELNGGSQDPDNPVSYNIRDDSLTLYPVHRSNDIFVGWYSSPDFTAESMVEFIPACSSGDLTLYARWSVTHTLTYSINNESEEEISHIIGEGVTETLMANSFSNANYTFIGWANSPDASVPDYDDEGDYTMGSSDAVIYAVWKSWYSYNEFGSPNTIQISGFSEFWDGTTNLEVPHSIDGRKTNGISLLKDSSLEFITINSDTEDFTIESSSMTGTSESKLQELTLNGKNFWLQDSSFSAHPLLKNVRFQCDTVLLERKVFKGCTSLESVILPAYIQNLEIRAEVFQNCTSLTTINIPDSVQKISSNAFIHCEALETLDLPSHLLYIEQGAIAHCKSLRSITIPQTIFKIENLAFKGCTSLSSVTINDSTPCTLGTDVFTDCASDMKIYVPVNSVDAYKSAANWSVYADRIEAKP